MDWDSVASAGFLLKGPIGRLAEVLNTTSKRSFGRSLRSPKEARVLTQEIVM
jgi:hypothetical protein